MQACGDRTREQAVEEAVRQAVAKFSPHADSRQMLTYWLVQLTGMPAQSPVCHSILTMVRTEYFKLLERR